MKLHVVGNRNAPEAIAEIERLGHEVESLAATDSESTREAIRLAIVEDAAERIVVVGGDGMVHQAINAIVPLNRDVALALIPMGSGNDFARALGIPVNDPVASARLAVGPAKKVDLLQTDYGFVATVATCGFPAKVNRCANGMKLALGSQKYTLATVMQLPRLQSDVVSISIDGGSALRSDITMLAIGNTAWFGGGMKVCPTARCDDQRADLLWAEDLSRFELLRFLPSIFSGSHVANAKARTATGQTIHLEGSSSVELWGDGEFLGMLPCTVRVAPSVLSVAFPSQDLPK